MKFLRCVSLCANYTYSVPYDSVQMLEKVPNPNPDDGKDYTLVWVHGLDNKLRINGDIDTIMALMSKV